jgi:ribosome-associated protein
MTKDIAIKTEKIQLDQFLKWADIIQSGGQVRVFLDEQRIYINQVLCHEKRKQLHPGDIVDIKGVGSYRVVGE